VSTAESTEPAVDYAAYVQRRTDGRWVVAVWVERAAQYQAPMTAAERRLTGCHTHCARTVDGLGGGYWYARRADALRRARQLYGPEGRLS